MTSQDKFLRRLLACTFAGSSLLAFPGCGMTSRARQEPDHVYSTTTPQMLEQQSRGEPVPVQATYPEDSAAVPKASEEGAGVARIPSQHSAPIDPMKGHASAGKVQLVSWQAEQVEQECPPGFYPAEPRVECDPNGPPIYRRETVAWSSLAEMYPDEYVYDGGDGNYPASVHTPQRSGIESEDTVAGFTDHTGDQRTAVSNRVAVYAPRFGFAREREHGIRTAFHSAMDHASEVHAKEREARIRDRVDERPAKVLSFRMKLKVLPAKRNDAFLQFLAAQSSHAITVEPAAVNDFARFKRIGGTVQEDFVRLLFHSVNTAIQMDVRATLPQQLTQLFAHTGIVDDTCFRHVNRLQPGTMRFQFSQSIPVNHFAANTILLTTAEDQIQLRKLFFADRDDHFSGLLPGNAVLRAEPLQSFLPQSAVLCSQ